MQSRDFLDQVSKVKGLTDMAHYVSLSDQRRMLIGLPSQTDQAWFVRQVEPIGTVPKSPRDIVYKLDTLPYKAWISWSCFARCFPEEMLVSNHLTTTEQCQVAGGPFWDGANRSNP